MPAPATTSSTWHETKLLKKKIFLFVCIPKNTTFGPSLEALYIKLRHVKLLFAHFDICRC